MENQVEAYKKQFKLEELELIVRISWCWKKGGSKFDMLDNCYKAQARFDKAFNVKTGEVIDAGFVFHWLEWLAPKKMFGFPYGYQFKKGNLYRVLVREYIPNENDRFKKYYIEQVLEENVHEPRLDAVYSFESQFEEQRVELTVLVKKRICGWATIPGYRIPRATFIASIDNGANELNESYGTLTWIEKDRKADIQFNFETMGTYRVRARKHKENKNAYQLLEVIKKVTDDRLEGVKEEYLKTVIIQNEFGDFKLDRMENRFAGQIDYLGEKSLVYMNVEEGKTTADIQFNKLREICSHLADWNGRVQEFASSELLELANDWNEEEVEITREQFIERIGIPDITIDVDGSMWVMFGDDDMFAGHSIVIDIDENGNFQSADIVG